MTDTLQPGSLALAVHREALAAVEQDDLAQARALAADLHAMRFTGAFEVEALIARAEGDLERAVERLQAGLERGPRVWLLWQLLGNTLSDLGRLDAAGDAYRAALGCPEADVASVRLNMAILELRRGRHDVGIAALGELRDGSEDEELTAAATDAWLYGLRLRRDRQLRGATVFELSLDAPVEAGAEAGEYRCCVRVQVVAESADAARQIVADDLADELPGFVIEELRPTGAPIDAAAGIHWMSGLVLYSADADA